MTNLAHCWVKARSKTLAQAREEYDGACIDFAGDFLDAIGRGRLAYFDWIMHPAWRYHAAVEIDGLIHDLWIDDVMSTDALLELLGGGEVSYPLEEGLQGEME